MNPIVIAAAALLALIAYKNRAYTSPDRTVANTAPSATGSIVSAGLFPAQGYTNASQTPSIGNQLPIVAAQGNYAFIHGDYDMTANLGNLTNKPSAGAAANARPADERFKPVASPWNNGYDANGVPYK